ncbi:MAG: CBASS cGAMP-activated phospholipase [Phycisphaerales bacterium]
MNDRFYILSVDGGGFRGLFSAHLLKRMEEEWKLDWRTRFGMFAGTSTGSILAAGLACGLSATQLTKFYETHGRTIFTPRLRSRLDFLKILTSRYTNKKLLSLLRQEFGDNTLGDVPVPLILPAVDIGNGCVHVFKSKYADGFVRDPLVPIADAVMASCAAPTYFDPHILGQYQLVDGGLWANNPSLVAVIDAHYRLKIPLEDMRILSIGTGKSNTFYPHRTDCWKDWLIRSWQGWGFVTRWQRSKLLDLILNLQSDNAHNMLCLLLGESPLDSQRVCRLTFTSDQRLPMDSVCKRDDWIAKADHLFTHHANKIHDFLELNRSHT